MQADHKKAFKRFEEASGWKKLDLAGIKAAGVSQDDIEKLDQRRRNATTDPGDVVHKGKVYSPGEKDKYWEVDQTAIPSDDRWQYAKGDSQEHFAEVYAKAVHMPETLYGDLIERPAHAARTALAQVAKQKEAIEQLKADKSPANATKLQTLTAQLAAYEQAAATAERAAKQRSTQFDIMRNDIFGTDKSMTDASARLRTRNISADKIRAFEQRAAHASTPAQVAAMEKEVR